MDEEKKFTLIDRKTQIASLVIIVVGVIVIGSVFLYILPQLFEEEKNDDDTSDYISTYYDERFFGTWINESSEINETCTSLFTEYTFYSNGTGMTPFGKIYWRNEIHHRHNDSVSLHIYSYYFEDTPYNYDYYAVYPSYNFSNDNNTLMLKAFDEDLYGRIPEGNKVQNWCWTTMFYTKQ